MQKHDDNELIAVTIAALMVKYPEISDIYIKRAFLEYEYRDHVTDEYATKLRKHLIFLLPDGLSKVIATDAYYSHPIKLKTSVINGVWHNVESQVKRVQAVEMDTLQNTYLP